MFNADYSPVRNQTLAKQSTAKRIAWRLDRTVVVILLPQTRKKKPTNFERLER